MPPVHIIAEAGTNHGGNLQTAKSLIDAAVAAAANSVKFQIIYPEGLYLREFWQDGKYVPNEVFAKRQTQMLTDDQWREVAAYAKSVGLPISASVFDKRGLKLVSEFDPPFIKIASCDLNNSRLLKQAAELGRKLIVSTGMASLGDVERAVEAVLSTGHRDLVLMHCVSVYPCPTSNMNMSFLKTLKTAFDLPVGLSDHTENSLAAAMGVALGVEWIEKHFTLDRTSDGFDHAYAMEPGALKSYISDVRAAEAACAKPTAKVGEKESGVKVRARRGVFAACDLPVGTVITDEHLLVVRPESEFAPWEADSLVGRTLTRAMVRAEAFKRSALE